MLSFFENIFIRVWNFFALNEQKVDNLILTVVVILGFYIIKNIAQKFIRRKIKAHKPKYFWYNLIKYTYILSTVVFILVIWFEGIDNVADFIGLISAGLVISLKDPILNFFGWIYIVSTRPFEVGDRIEIDGVKGDVIDIGANQFVLNEIAGWVDGEQSTGRIIQVPNYYVFTIKQTNYSQGIPYIWNEMHIVVTFESDWQVTKQLLTEIINEKAEKITLEKLHKKGGNSNYFIYYNNLSPIIYTSVKASGVQLSIRFLVDPKKRRGTEVSIWEACLIEFSKRPNQIQWAYPTTRLYRFKEEKEY